LAETEAFATHVGFLDSGKLRFSEEMKTLAAKFREVELTFDGPQTVPQSLPQTWIHLTASDNFVRFVDTDFDLARHTAEICQCFGPVRNATYTAMSLRAIFLALAKTSLGAW
jgi:ABC-2 type transport system ATP-binding protein